MRRPQSSRPAAYIAAGSIALCLWMAIAAGAAVGPSGDVTVVDLATDGASELLGTDEAKPRLSWRLESSRRGVMQQRFQVLVASSPARLTPEKADVWDSGRVRTPHPWVDYGGPVLAPRSRSFWTVRVWDERGVATAFAAPTWFETAFLGSDWKAKWIAGPARGFTDGLAGLVDAATVAATGDSCRPVGAPGPLSLATDPDREAYLARWRESCRAIRPAPRLRREFVVNAQVERARLYVAGLAYADVSLNGEPLGDGAVLEPGYTDYAKTVLYVTYDVTEKIQRGANALAIELGSGFFDYDVTSEWSWTRADWRGDPRVRVELHLDLAGGFQRVIRSDDAWRTSLGPTRYDNINIGETYDARFEQPGWGAPGFDDSAWSAARIVDAPKGTLVAETHEPIAILGRRPPAAVTEPREGILVYDAGEQITGWLELEIEGEPGQAAEITYAERLTADGLADSARNLHVADRLQSDHVVVGDSGSVRFRPRFSYKGFRYAQLSGPRDGAFAGRVKHVEVQVVRSAVRSTGDFSSDDELANGIFAAVERAIGTNLHGIVTDTPVYEKNGWTGDAQITAPTAATLFDLRRFYTKWLRDMRDSQNVSGELPVIVPSGGQYGYTGVGWESAWGAKPVWDAALFVIPWEVYRRYGDERPLRDSYPAMRRYVDAWLPQWAPEHVVDSDLGDWVSPASALTTLAPTAYSAEVVRQLGEAAALFGKRADRERDHALHAEIRDAFEATFFDPEAGVYRESPGDAFAQTAQVLPLAFGLAPPDRRASLEESLVADIAARGGNLATGIAGTRYLLEELTAAGHIDVAWGIVKQTDAPSWGQWLELGYTALSENWGESFRSIGHHMLGSVGQWLVEDLAGIEPLAPGYAEIELRPEVPSTGLDHAEAAIDTVRGPAGISWRKSDGGFALDVVVPPNAQGVVHVPARDPSDVSEIGEGVARPADRATGVELVRTESGRVVYRVGSGRYEFRVGTARP